MSKSDDSNSVNQSRNIAYKSDIAGRDITKNTYIINIDSSKSQLESLYSKLEDERTQSRDFREIVDELLHYKEPPQGIEVMGLEAKLKDGKRERYLDFARTSKENFFKKLIKNQHSEISQIIYALLLAKVYSNFQTYIYPQLDQLSENDINNLVTGKIIKPIEEILGDNLLKIFEDEVYGMLYFLTGNCHLKWKFHVSI